VSRTLYDGMIWIAIGVSLTFQAAVLLLASVPREQGGLAGSGPPDMLATTMVTSLLLGLGVGAIYWGLRRLVELGQARTTSRDRQSA